MEKSLLVLAILFFNNFVLAQSATSEFPYKLTYVMYDREILKDKGLTQETISQLKPYTKIKMKVLIYSGNNKIAEKKLLTNELGQIDFSIPKNTDSVVFNWVNPDQCDAENYSSLYKADIAFQENSSGFSSYFASTPPGITFNHVQFISNKSDIDQRDDQSITELNTIAYTIYKLILNPHYSCKKFEIRGHTDGDGTAEANLVLSQKRAKFVLDYVINFITQYEEQYLRPWVQQELEAKSKAIEGENPYKRIVREEDINNLSAIMKMPLLNTLTNTWQSRLIAIGKGESELIRAEKGPKANDNKAINRRVEIRSINK